MVHVLVGNEYRHDLIRILAYLAQPAADLAAGEAGVYQESGLRVPEGNAIAVTAAAQNAKLKAYDEAPILPAISLATSSVDAVPPMS